MPLNMKAAWVMEFLKHNIYVCSELFQNIMVHTNTLSICLTLAMLRIHSTFFLVLLLRDPVLS